VPSKWTDIHDAIYTVTAGLSFTGLTAANIHKKELAFDRTSVSFTPPGIVVARNPGDLKELPGSIGKDDWAYPILVFFVKVSNQDTSQDDAFNLWQETVRNAFHNKRLSGVTTVWRCYVEPGPALDPSLFQQANLSVGAMTIRSVDRRLRT
jgi:hypothetical protein